MLLQPKIHLYMPKYIVVIFRNFSAQNACAKILLRTQRVSVTWLKIRPCLRSRQKEWELDHYLFSSLWHVYLMFVISILENLKGKKIVFWDVTLTRLVPIWGVLPNVWKTSCGGTCLNIFEYIFLLIMWKIIVTCLNIVEYLWISFYNCFHRWWYLFEYPSLSKRARICALISFFFVLVIFFVFVFVFVFLFIFVFLFVFVFVFDFVPLIFFVFVSVITINVIIITIVTI